jgi:hypothetical protein
MQGFFAVFGENKQGSTFNSLKYVDLKYNNVSVEIRGGAVG